MKSKTSKRSFVRDFPFGCGPNADNITDHDHAESEQPSVYDSSVWDDIWRADTEDEIDDELVNECMSSSRWDRKPLEDQEDQPELKRRKKVSKKTRTESPKHVVQEECLEKAADEVTLLSDTKTPDCAELDGSDGVVDDDDDEVSSRLSNPEQGQTS